MMRLQSAEQEDQQDEAGKRWWDGGADAISKAIAQGGKKRLDCFVVA